MGWRRLLKTVALDTAGSGAPRLASSNPQMTFIDDADGAGSIGEVVLETSTKDL